MRFAESSGDNLLLLSCPAPFSRALGRRITKVYSGRGGPALLWNHLGIGGVDGPQHAHEFFDFPLVQQALLVDLHPSFLFDFLVGIPLACHLPQMLASMV